MWSAAKEAVLKTGARKQEWDLPIGRRGARSREKGETSLARRARQANFGP